MSQELIERLRMEAQMHAQEARTANATIAEIYQLCSGGKGEPGNWHGADPVRALIAERDQLAATLRQQAARVDEGVGGLCQRNPAPNAAQPMGATSPTVRLEAALSAQPAPEYDEDVVLRALADDPDSCADQFAQPAERQGECEAVCPEDRFEQYVAAAIARSPEPLRELGEYLTRVLDEDQFPTADRLLLQLATAHLAAPVGVPDVVSIMAHLPDNRAATRAELIRAMALAAAPSAPQGGRRTNYVSGSVDSTGRFQPTQQDDTAAPQGKGDMAEIFVFGSNEAGRHGKGAALFARQKHGAIYGQGEGLQGNSYAIPTKDAQLRTLPISVIRTYVERFKSFAASRHDLLFRLTPIGCGLAGYSPADIAPLFDGVPGNVVLPPEFTHPTERK